MDCVYDRRIRPIMSRPWPKQRHADRQRTITYARVVCADRPEKNNPKRVRITCGGDRIDFPGDVSTKTADIVTVKVLLNSVISTPGARFMTGDLKDFYLYTPTERFEYMCISVKIIPSVTSMTFTS